MTATPPSITLADVQAAGTAIRRAITDADGPLPPSFLVDFLLREWRRYLARVHHEHGLDSIDWRYAVDTTRRLLFSSLPVGDAEQRQQLTRSLPILVADLKTGMAIAGTPPAARESFLGQLRDLHLMRLDPDPAARHNITQEIDLADTIAMDVRDPRYRALLDKLDGADAVEHIEM